MRHWLSADRKIYYHIEIPRTLAAKFWSMMAGNFEFIVTRRQHSPNGKDLSIELKVTKSKESIASSESSMTFTEKRQEE